MSPRALFLCFSSVRLLKSRRLCAFREGQAAIYRSKPDGKDCVTPRGMFSSPKYPEKARRSKSAGRRLCSSSSAPMVFRAMSKLTVDLPRDGAGCNRRRQALEVPAATETGARFLLKSKWLSASSSTDKRCIW
jgi:hypothetical protein